MRNRFILVLGLFLALSTSIYAQKEGVGDKVSAVLTKFDAAIKPDKAKRSSIETIFTDFYTAQDKLRNNIQGSSTLAQGLQQDYQSVRKQNENLFTERDNQLKKALSAEEYKKWKEDIEPSIRKSGKK
ncbi:hypothetical protein [Niabella drilacis]|uniref:LTXXQ motif family protein n=1 Tax=Niabella drilacis (strain DSM 25811 / CCM 8410 / CCUG 62505 / LMG 26954 / E90) TaxID=1285928 RepID=A0A1G6Q4F8_NIADE|nr:hypothetical protein [Niabella drilacis]SDC87350.1 hypothetical protein SAMN04487894_104278 [Niabella drilacis]